MKQLLIALFTLCALSTSAQTKKHKAPKEKDMKAYLMVYFNDPTHSLFMALSPDGYTFTSLNESEPIMRGDTISLQKGIRDPHIFRGPDGAFYLSMTDLHIYAKKEGLRDDEWERDGAAFGWGNNRALVLMKSFDLINWTRSNFRVDTAFPGFEEIGCAWAPETTYDPVMKKIMVYFSMRFKNGINRLYYSYADDAFTKLETEPKLLFEYPKDITYIDADITQVGNQYHMFYVPHDGTPGIKQAISNSINSGYQYIEDWCDPEPTPCEAPNVWKRLGTDTYVLMYDIYGIQPHNFGFCETTDFKTFTSIGRFNEGVMTTTNFTSPKHGAVIHLTKKEAERLAKHWATEMKF